MVIMAALVIPILWIGIYPKPILDRMERSAAQFISDVERGAAERTGASRVGN
jgi:NADH:ubiquinone oxidoreductase subunit 4 (subunit M)